MVQNKIKYSIIFIAILTSCNENNFNFKQRFRFVNNSINEFYIEKQLTNHFPEYNDNSSIVSYFMSSPDKNVSVSEIFLIKKYNATQIEDEIMKNKYIFEARYSDDMFFHLRLSWIRDSVNYYLYDYNEISEKYPVPVFILVDFGHSYEYDEKTIDNDKEIFWEKSVLPDDLYVYLIDAEKGDFWKNKEDSIRPEILGEWKHG